jgi:hypothetical protein
VIAGNARTSAVEHDANRQQPRPRAVLGARDVAGSSPFSAASSRRDRNGLACVPVPLPLRGRCRRGREGAPYLFGKARETILHGCSTSGRCSPASAGDGAGQANAPPDVDRLVGDASRTSCAAGADAVGPARHRSGGWGEAGDDGELHRARAAQRTAPGSGQLELGGARGGEARRPVARSLDDDPVLGAVGL